MVPTLKCVVVGGGVAGLVAALLAVKKGHHVSIVESSRECGGLLGSFRGTDGHFYDYGAHLLRYTCVGPLDRLLFGGLRAADWQRFPYLNHGVYFSGTYREKNRFPNVNFLPNARYEQGLAEILRCPPGERSLETAGDYLLDRFGATFTNDVFAPAALKFYGTTLENLVVSALRPFGLNRIIVSTPEVSRELKRSAHFDSRFAFHSSEEGLSKLISYYPTRGGIGQWVQTLQHRLESQGASICTGVRVASLSHNAGHVEAVTLSDGRRLAADHLIWTIHAGSLLQQASLPVPSFRPALRKSCLYFYAVDEPFRVGSHFYICYDLGLRTFRTTLYSNLRSDPSERSHHSCCVEVLCEAQETEPGDAEVLQEQVAMGVVDGGARWTLVGKKIIPNGFPVPTPESVTATEDLANSVAENFDNVLLLGKASSGVFLMEEILKNTYDVIEQRL